MNNAKGLYGKYIVTKSDGTPVSGRCFILKPDKDPVAVKALQTYASATDNELLRNDLFAWVGKPMQIANDLISKEALLHVVRQCRQAVNKCANHDYMVGYVSALSGVEVQIAEAPAVDAEPVRHGRWIEPDYVYFGAKQYICDQCKDDEYWEKRCHNYKENYCPNCGAKMDGGNIDE